MATIKKINKIVLSLLLGLSTISNAVAEGSYELRGKSGANDIVRIEGKRDNYNPAYTLGLGRVTIFKVDILDSTKEVIDLYTSNPEQVNETRDIAVWCPNNTPSSPESGNSYLSADAVINVAINGNGYIGSWNDVVSVQSVNTRVRPPQTFNPVAEGCGNGTYTVRFFTHATNNSRSYGNGLRWMDIGVRDTNFNSLIKGRAFSNHYSLIQNGFNEELNFNLFVVEGEDSGDDYEGFVWEIDANGVQPFSFQLVSNSVGASPNEFNDDSIPLSSNPTPSMLAEYPIYLNYPDKTVILPPSQPNITNFFYNNICPDDNDQDGYTTGGNFNFYSNGVWKYKLYIDINNDGEVNLNEKVFQGTASSGLNRVYWDGILPNGSSVPNGTNLKFNLYLSDGEVHFPFVDVENRSFDTGPIFTLRNASTSDSNYFYWNDKPLSGGGTTTMNGSLSNHTWANNLGNGALVDTWKYAYNSGLQKNVIYGGECTVPDLGGSVSGYVFDDLNHNATKENGENGIPNVTVVLHNVTNNDCETQKTDANGYYLFDNILISNFNLVESANETLPIAFTCPPIEEDPAGYISVDANTKVVSFNELNASYLTFANYKGYKVEGKTFIDNGLGSNLAHNGIQDGNEITLNNIKVEALNGGSVFDYQYTLGDGSFEFWIPDTIPTVKFKTEDKLNYSNVSTSVGTTAAIVNNETEMTTTGLTGKHSGISFGYIAEPTITGTQSKTIQAGSTTTYTHKYRINSIGTTSFSIISESNTPNDLNTNSIIYNDLNCNGTIDPTDSTNVTNLPTNINTSNETCLIVKVFTPLNAPNNSSYSYSLNADVNYTNIPLVISKDVTDLTIITAAGNNSSLVLIKSVDKTNALPNEIITYTVTAKNNGQEVLDNIIINDFTPAFTNFDAALCPAILTSGMTSCDIITNPAVGSTGNVQWGFTGVLYSSEEISVTYRVRVDN